MEKLILLGLAVWLSFVLTDGFPTKPVVKPFNLKSEISKTKVNQPEALKYKWVRTNYD